MDRQTGRIAARAREARAKRLAPGEAGAENASLPALVGVWLRRLDTQSRWYLAAGVGIALGFVVPASWAYGATNSVNEAVAVLQVRPPLELLPSSLPSAGLVAIAVIIGAAIAVLPPAAVLRRCQPMSTLSARARLLVVALTIASAVLTGPITAFGLSLVPAFAGATWPSGATAGSLIGGSAILLAIAAGEPRSVGQPRRKLGLFSERAGILLAVLWVVPLGQALSLAPHVVVEDSAGIRHDGLLLDIASEGVWIIEQPEDDFESGTVVLIDANLATLNVATR